MVKRKKNPEEIHGFGDAAKGVYARMDAKKAEGKRLAEANRAHVEKMVREGRYGADVSTRNTIRALKMMPWENDVSDWQRLYEAEMIVRLANARKKRKPSAAELKRMGAEVAREYVRRHGHPNEDQHRRNPGRTAPAPDMTAAHELVLYITNDGRLYRQRTQPIIRNLRRKIAAKNFNQQMAYKAWMYLADAGSVKYTREFGSAGDRNLFDVPTRWAAAKELHEHYQEEIGEVEGRRSNPMTRRQARIIHQGPNKAVIDFNPKTGFWRGIFYERGKTPTQQRSLHGDAWTESQLRTEHPDFKLEIHHRSVKP
jgi:hypothetical protein